MTWMRAAGSFLIVGAASLSSEEASTYRPVLGWTLIEAGSWIQRSYGDQRSEPSTLGAAGKLTSLRTCFLDTFASIFFPFTLATEMSLSPEIADRS
jgi:hypothetical protein